MPNLKQNKNDRQTGDRLMIAGIQKRMPNVALTLAGQATTGPALVALLQKRIDLDDAAAAQHTSWRGAVKAVRDEIAATALVVKAFRKYLESLYGEDVTALGDFGLSPAKKAAPPPKVKAAAAVKAAATRKALGTKGPKQKKAAKQAPAPEPAPMPAPAPAKP